MRCGTRVSQIPDHLTRFTDEAWPSNHTDGIPMIPLHAAPAQEFSSRVLDFYKLVVRIHEAGMRLRSCCVSCDPISLTLTFAYSSRRTVERTLITLEMPIKQKPNVPDSYASSNMPSAMTRRQTNVEKNTHHDLITMDPLRTHDDLHSESSFRLLTVRGPLSLDAMLQDPWVLLNGVQGQPLLRI